MTIYVMIYRCRGCWRLYGAEPGGAPAVWLCQCGQPIDYFYSEPGYRSEPILAQTEHPTP